MIKRAKASILAVKQFSLSATAVRDYTPKLDKGLLCLDDLLKLLSDYTSSIQTTVADMKGALENLAIKIKSIEEILAKLNAQLNSLEERLSALESELSSIPASITLTNEDGESYEISNPAYDAVCAKIALVEGEIASVETEIYPHQARLDRAISINSKMESHIDSLNGVVYSLEEKKTTCRQIKSDLEDAKSDNLSQGTAAVDGLKKLEDTISSYLKIKMVYENAAPTGGFASPSQGINININVNRTTVVQEHTIVNQQQAPMSSFSNYDIERHKISFDNKGRISSYDGKSFGGQYNSYEDRLSHTSTDDNPIFGRYEGNRGESKYIPSNRTVEGVIVNEILSQYGIDGIEYRNAEPDFEVCAEAVVSIAAMTENRENYVNTDGEYTLGNFSQADLELAKAWNLGQRGNRNDWTGRDVLEYRKANRLTWHEKCDTKTMVLVRFEINLFFKHSGGCSECRLRDAAQDNGGGFDE